MPAPANLVHQTATSTGTGNFTLAKVNGKNDFATAFTTGGSNVFDYFISNRDAAEWERGTGHMDTTSDLVRDDIIQTSAGTTAAIDFTAGTKDVTNDIPALTQVRGTTVASSGFLAVIDTTAGNLIKGGSIKATTAAVFPTTNAGMTVGTTANAFSAVHVSTGGGFRWPSAALEQSGTLLVTSGTTISGASVNLGTTAVRGALEVAEDTEYRANTAGGLALTPAKVWSAAGSFALSNSSANVAVDMSTFLTLATLAMATNHTLSDPSSPKVGQHFIVSVGSSTSWTLTLSTAYKLWAGIEVGPYTVTSADKLYIAGFIESSTGCRVTAVGRTTVIA